MLELNHLYLMDCMDGMKQFPDGFFELAIVDPPYGIEKAFTASSRIAKYGQLRTANDLKPDNAYFDELFRVSCNQIIWGYNHLSNMLPSTTEFIYWYKHQPVKSYSAGELAWTSFSGVSKCFDFAYFGGHGADITRIHPTQKPVALYRWLLNNYAKRGDKILDTHVGSASSLLACIEAKFDFVGFEIDPDYHAAAIRRMNTYRPQECLFVDV